MHLHIFTLSWNGLPLLRALWPTLAPNLVQAGLSWAWHVKDNGSSDGSAKEVQTWDQRIKVYAYPDNKQNYSEGMNYLFEQARPDPDDLILTLNNDIEFRDDKSLSRMINCRKRHDAGVVGARLLYTGTNVIQHAGVIFEPKHLMPIHFGAHRESTPECEKDRQFQAVTGAIQLMRAKDFGGICRTNKSGRPGMDERFQWAFEDIDACLSILHNTGKKVVMCGSTQISHGESVSLKKNPINKLFMQQSVMLFKTKWANQYSIDAIRYTDPVYCILK